MDRKLYDRGMACVHIDRNVPDMSREELIEFIGMLDELATQRGQIVELAKRVRDDALPKFNWGASPLDAKAIDTINQFGLALAKLS